MKIYFIRHAEGYHNISKEGRKIFYPDLTSVGIEQAKKIDNKFKELENISDLVNEGILTIKKGKIDEFAKILDETWKYK